MLRKLGNLFLRSRILNDIIKFNFYYIILQQIPKLQQSVKLVIWNPNLSFMHFGGFLRGILPDVSSRFHRRRFRICIAFHVLGSFLCFAHSFD